MSQAIGEGRPAPASSTEAVPVRSVLRRRVATYAATIAMVALATGIGLVVRAWVAAPNVTLVFVLPAIVAATAHGWGAAVLACAAGVAAFDFLFTQPYYSFRIANPSDIWAAVLLLAIAGIVCALAAQSRRRALEAQRAARHAALQALAHAVIAGRSRGEVLVRAAEALHAMFDAPALVLVEDDGALSVATAGGAEVSEGFREAAKVALDARLHIPGGLYPYEDARFDLWPVAVADGRRWVLGVDFTRAEQGRPDAPLAQVEVVAGYLAAALAPSPAEAA
jgi:K+-sensing histidine kinase KdpD